MTRTARTTRRRDAAAYQCQYREQQTALRRPSRDDVARVALHWAIMRTLRPGRERNYPELLPEFRVIIASASLDLQAPPTMQ